MKKHFSYVSLKLLFFVFCLNFSSCSLFAGESCPYLVNGEVRITTDADEFELAGFDLYFLNKSEKRIESFTIVFYLFDEDGEPVSNGRCNFVLSIKKTVDAGDSMETCISLDSYLQEIPEYSYEVDYLYVSKINYEDGSVWDDPLGLYAF